MQLVVKNVTNAQKRALAQEAKKNGMTSSGLMKHWMQNLVDKVERQKSGTSAKRIQELSETLLEIKKLEYHNKNFLCNVKFCCSMQVLYLEEIMRLNDLHNLPASDKP